MKDLDNCYTYKGWILNLAHTANLSPYDYLYNIFHQCRNELPNYRRIYYASLRSRYECITCGNPLPEEVKLHLAAAWNLFS